MATLRVWYGLRDRIGLVLAAALLLGYLPLLWPNGSAQADGTVPPRGAPSVDRVPIRSPLAVQSVCYDHVSPIEVTETITDLGGGQWRYSYAFTNSEPFAIWLFAVWTGFETSQVTVFADSPDSWSAYSSPIDNVIPEADARNLDPSITWASATEDSDWPYECPNRILSGSLVSGFSFVATVLDENPKWLAYDRVGYYFGEEGCFTAVGQTGGASLFAAALPLVLRNRNSGH
jgi:hypothetical protein